MLLSTLRITTIFACFAVAGALGGLIGAKIGSLEVLRTAFSTPVSPEPRQWADI